MQCCPVAAKIVTTDLFCCGSDFLFVCVCCRTEHRLWLSFYKNLIVTYLDTLQKRFVLLRLWSNDTNDFVSKENQNSLFLLTPTVSRQTSWQWPRVFPQIYHSDWCPFTRKVWHICFSVNFFSNNCNSFVWHYNWWIVIFPNLFSNIFLWCSHCIKKYSYWFNLTTDVCAFINLLFYF